ncbi:NACHT domain-containing protein [Actinomadura chibensis]|uniref:NACHT domain-containing protein n=1 Tax=Actinomadura chibensis TaxID=392828 RepID=A0A5D0NU75_9ACTN|nr:NACHT domain-containing protein [Actinomadura chibensis]TYB47927.1 NACHT domain-containing protein [Actinomadura chibensis]
MNKIRRVARIVTLAALAVAASVAANQVLNAGTVSLRWAYVALAVAVLAALYGEVFAAGSRAPEQSPIASGRSGVYLRQLRASVAHMEIVGIATQSEFVMGMRQVYVDVSLAPKPSQETAREKYIGAVTEQPGERRTLESFLTDRSRRVHAVIGGPGSGKTTLVRHTALRLCERRLFGRQALPVLLYMRDHAGAILAEEPSGLAEVAAAAGWLAGKIPASWLERRLDRGGCVVLMDGLDEVADEDDRVRVVAWIKRQIERFPDNRYVLTSRPHGYLSNPLGSAEVLQVRRFTGDQVSRFLRGWYYAIECRALGSSGPHIQRMASGKADDLLGRLRGTPALYDLAANPLLLTMIANVHRYRGELPGSRSGLYREMCDVLLHRRQEARGLKDATGLRGAQKERVARALALAMMRAEKRDMRVGEADRAIAQVLRGVSQNVAPKTFLDEARKSGLLVEREQGVYSFAHLTLQEYLAAAQIGQQPECLRLIVDNVDNPWWRETTLLWAAEVDATPVIAACLARATVRSLSLGFDCAEQALEVDPDVRRDLEELLQVREFADDAQRRLITGVRASRALREVVWTVDGTTVCAHPVSRQLYAQFVRDERAAGLHTPLALPRADENDAETPASGLWPDDNQRFLGWLNALFDDGTTYRLPTAAELGDSATELIPEVATHAVWIKDDPERLRHQRVVGERPFYGWAGRWMSFPGPDLDPTRGHRELAFSSHPDQLLAFGHVYTVARALGAETGAESAADGGDRTLRMLALASMRSLDRCVAKARLLEGMSGEALLARRDLVTEFDVEVATARNLLTGVVRRLNRSGRERRAQATVLQRAAEQIRVRADELHFDLQRTPATDGPAIEARIRTLIETLTEALRLSREATASYVGELEGELERVLFAPSQDLPVEGMGDFDRVRSSNRIDGSVLYLDLAVRFAQRSDREALDAIMTAFRHLRRYWNARHPEEATRNRPGFEQVISDIREDLTAWASWREWPIEYFLHLAETTLAPAMSSLSPPFDDRSAGSLAGLPDNIVRLVRQAISREKPVDFTELACVRMEILALFTLMDATLHQEHMRLLADLYHVLIAFQDGEAALNRPSTDEDDSEVADVLILVRN